MKYAAVILFFLNPILWASFYAVSKGAVGVVDPLLFSTMELSIAAVPALAILIWRRRLIAPAAVLKGVRLGLLLYLAVIGSTVALYFTTATNTAFFPALNGAFAAVITAVVLRKTMHRAVWMAVLLSVMGAGLLIMESRRGGGNSFGDLIALGAAAVYTVYIFLVDREAGEGTLAESDLWIPFACELFTMALCGLSVEGVQVFGLHQTHQLDQLVLPYAWWNALYIGVLTTFVPTAIGLFFQRYISPVTVAFLYVLEPVWGALAAHLLRGEVLAPLGYVAGALIVAGSLVNTFGAMSAAPNKEC